MTGSGTTGATQRSTWVTIVVAVVGLLAVVAAFGIAVFGMDNATDAAGVLAPVLTVIGTLVGGIVGVRVGSEGKEQVQNELMGTVHTMTELGSMRIDDIKRVNDQLLDSVKAREELAARLTERAMDACVPQARSACTTTTDASQDCRELNASLKELIDLLKPKPSAPTAPAQPDPPTLRLDAEQLKQLLEALAKLAAKPPQN